MLNHTVENRLRALDQVRVLKRRLYLKENEDLESSAQARLRLAQVERDVQIELSEGEARSQERLAGVALQAAARALQVVQEATNMGLSETERWLILDRLLPSSSLPRTSSALLQRQQAAPRRSPNEPSTSHASPTDAPN